MPSCFVELKFDDGIRNFTEANFPNYRASHQGCWDYNRDNPDNPNMVCVAEYENGAWKEIGYIVVNRGGVGRALPWGKSASEAFRDFAQSEKICKNKIHDFLNARYPGKPSITGSASKTKREKTNKRTSENTSPAQGLTSSPSPAAGKTLNGSKRIILQNFEKFQKAYEKEFGKKFLGSEHQSMFFPNRTALDAVLEWNENADNIDSLIDLCAFYELTLGNPAEADVVILGNNPGDKELAPITSFDPIFAEMKDRENNKNVFYPMSSTTAMQRRPWFPNRLIYGVGGTKWKTRREKDGILYPFIINNNLASLCKYAKKIATVEMVPYHTKNFSAGKAFLDEFDLFDPEPVIQAMENKAVIIALYRNAAERWCEKWRKYLEDHTDIKKQHSAVTELENYEHFYVNHKKKGASRAEANASLSRHSLRRSSDFFDSIYRGKENYPEYDAYQEIIDYLRKEKKW